MNPEALSAALKLAGQDTAQMDKTLRLIKTMQVIRSEGATPSAMLTLMAQYDPKYAAMAALVKAMGANQNTSQEQAPPPTDGPKDDGIQYNHF